MTSTAVEARQSVILHKDIDDRLWVFRRDDTRDDASPVEITESGDELAISACIPGVRSDDLAVEVERGVLNVEAGHEFETITDDGCFRVERRHAPLALSVELPDGIVRDDVEVTCDGGHVCVRIPKEKSA